MTTPAPFTLDAASREVWRDGRRTRLQAQPCAILAALLEHPGEVVTRDALCARLWPEGTFVDFEHGLNAAVKRLRAALGDDSREPTLVETVPRRGYRLIVAPQEPAPRPEEAPSHSTRVTIAVFVWTASST